MRVEYLSTQVCCRSRDEARVLSAAMQKNQARSNEQRRAASLIVLPAQRVDRFVLASAGHVIRIRRGFVLGGTKFADVIQFISRAGSACRLCGELRVIAGCIFLVSVLLGGSRRSI